MKLLFDQNLSHRLPKRLADLFPESTQVGALGMDRATDTAIWRYAARQGYAIVTQDSDFAESCRVRSTLRTVSRPNRIVPPASNTSAAVTNWSAGYCGPYKTGCVTG